MKDMIPKGTGNSRYLRSVSNFKAIYPTYDDFVNALVAGNLPVDFNGINEAGIQQVGTSLNKANLLTDEVARQVGLRTADPTPNDMFNVLANVGNLHVWERVQTYAEPVPEVPAGYTLGPVETDVKLLNYYNGSSATISVSDSISVSEDGSVSQVSPTSYTYNINVWTGSSYISIIRGKFCKITSPAESATNGTLPAGAKIFYVPSDASLSYTYSKPTYTLTIDKYQPVTGYPYTPAIPAGTTTDYLTSTDRNAYPDQSAEGGEPEKPAYYTLGNEQTNELIQTLGGSASLYFNVASSVSVADNGTVSLISPSQITLSASGSTMNLADYKTKCAGKFIVAKDQTYSNLKLFGIWYVGEDCEFTDVADSSAGTKTLSCSNMQLVTGHAKVEEIPANTTITYLGQLGGGSRIEVGSYVGTGTYGSLNPITLTFVGIPKLVIVEREQASGNSYSNGLGVFFYGQKIAQVHWHLRGSGSSNANVVLSWNQNAVSWYGNDSSSHLNDENVTYHYIAIG